MARSTGAKGSYPRTVNFPTWKTCAGTSLFSAPSIQMFREICQWHIQEGEGIFKSQVFVFKVQHLGPCAHDICYFQVGFVQGIHYENPIKPF